jgi:hypothetical protein
MISHGEKSSGTVYAGIRMFTREETGRAEGNSRKHTRLACWFESVALAQFTRRGGRPL